MDAIEKAEQPIQPKLGYEDWLRYQNLLHGIIYIDDSIGECCMSRVLAEISEIRRRQLQSVKIVISSSGGGAYYAFAIYDALMNLRNKGIKVIALVEGWAASAACMIVLQAADERLSRPEARFLMHEARRWIFWAVERTSDIKDEVQELEAITDRIMNILSKRCGKNVDEIRNRIERKEIWMSATEAKEWGLIDRIV